MAEFSTFVLLELPISETAFSGTTRRQPETAQMFIKRAAAGFSEQFLTLIFQPHPQVVSTAPVLLPIPAI